MTEAATTTETKTKTANGKTKAGLKLKPVDARRMTVTIKGTTPLMMHRWSEKAKEMMRKKHAGSKARNREVRNPEQEALDSTHFCSDGRYGIPANAIKQCIVNAAHKDLGLDRTLVRKGLFVPVADPSECLPIECSPPYVREDTVRVSTSAADLRYRHCFDDWRCTFTVEYDGSLLGPEEIFNLVTRAGFGVGLLEYRPEKGGDFGRFELAYTEEEDN